MRRCAPAPHWKPRVPCCARMYQHCRDDRYFHPDMLAASALVRSGALAQAVAIALPGVEHDV